MWHLRAPPSRRIKLYIDWLPLLSFPQSEQTIGLWRVNHVSICTLIGAPVLVLNGRHSGPAILCDLLVMIDAAVYTTSLLYIARLSWLGYFSGSLRKDIFPLIQFAHTSPSACIGSRPSCATPRCLPVDRRQEDGTALDGFCICPRWSIKILISW